MNKKNKNFNKEDKQSEAYENINGGETSLENDELKENNEVDEIKENEESSLEDQLSEAKDQLLRTLAESENLRRRLEREKEDLSNYIVSNFAKEILSVLDNLQRALKTISENEEKSADFKNFSEGIELTEKQLISVLEKFKINKINTVGEKFDPNLHQAMYEVEGKEENLGEISEVIQDGYKIGERLLRPAMVGVFKNKKT